MSLAFLLFVYLTGCAAICALLVALRRAKLREDGADGKTFPAVAFVAVLAWPLLALAVVGVTVVDGCWRKA